MSSKDSPKTATETLLAWSLDGLLPFTWTGALLCLLSSLLLWRICRFTILPWLSPNEPREFPYWVPCMLPEPRLSR